MGDAAEWARICAEFQEILRDANRFGLRARLTRLVERTRSGTRALADWRVLLADLERLRAAEESGGSRNGDSGRPWKSWTAAAETVDHVCPGGVCDRSAARVLGRAPTCDLLAAAMRPNG
ncbi:hypothetical protein B0I31_1264 [Saccharothrix carnea]|uniref:Uncharacterized protein n=2 Tax=Saccharothrix carnea TaxID=1280637 RepID=A0A2P8HIC3_SACCR|nr:hypothetical protein B0I31_1264 [Saccharothrix carnea]